MILGIGLNVDAVLLRQVKQLAHLRMGNIHAEQNVLIRTRSDARTVERNEIPAVLGKAKFFCQVLHGIRRTAGSEHNNHALLLGLQQAAARQFRDGAVIFQQSII